jgi:hypothetical protein
MAKRRTKTPQDGLIVRDPSKNPAPAPAPAPEPQPKPQPKPEPKPEPKPAPQPDPEPEIDPIEEPTPEPQPDEPAEKEFNDPEPEAPDASGTDSFEELSARIKAAEAPKEKKIIPDDPLVTRTRRKKRKGQSDPDSFRIEGYILMLVTDTVFPFTFAFINNMLDKRHKIEAHRLSLDDKDFAKLEPLADQAADYMNVNLNPIAGFLLVSTFMYGNNLMNVRMQMTAKE